MLSLYGDQEKNASRMCRVLNSFLPHAARGVSIDLVS